ncbi:ATP-binding protein [Bradyrhizobium sp. LB5.2]|uniref:AAA family ATPase n=1 Tax=Bradyrhizobium sp. LB5.2 TaxID=3156329 RepID=UPI0033987CA4
MLKKIRVSGFKSLDNFELEFRRGLNVLIGPNGSGKTNILNFIEFFSNLTRLPLLEAVSKSGGAGRIFRRSDLGLLTGQVSFTIIGDGPYQDHAGDKPVHVFYEYSAEITLSESNSALSYSRQSLKLAYGQRDLLEWPIDAELEGKNGEITSVRFSPSTARSFRDRYVPQKAGDPDIAEAVRTFATDTCATTALHEVLSRFIAGAGQIARDIRGAKSFNISPSSVRRAEDIASEPEISEDGSGLAAVLFAIENASRQRYYGYPYRYYARQFHPDVTLTKLIAYSKIVNDSIQQITVEPDAIENQLRIFLRIGYGVGSLKLPFSLVSDGTAKWFTLVTAIVTSPAVFAIEEPENFLHPLMQREIVKIVRETFTEDQNDAFAIMTTHSETILNCIDPDEMILVHMEQGRTVAKRPSNSDDIRKEIVETGFGAGYYYIAGAIE